MIKTNDYKIYRLGISDQLADKARVWFYLGTSIALLIIAVCVSKQSWFLVFIGGVAGLSAHWFSTYKCSMLIPCWCTDNKIREIIEEFNYEAIDINAHHYRVARLPRFLYFNHQDLVIIPMNGKRFLLGPRMMLKLVRQHIQKD